MPDRERYSGGSERSRRNHYNSFDDNSDYIGAHRSRQRSFDDHPAEYRRRLDSRDEDYGYEDRRRPDSRYDRYDRDDYARNGRDRGSVSRSPYDGYDVRPRRQTAVSDGAYRSGTTGPAMTKGQKTRRMIFLLAVFAASLACLFYITSAVMLSGVNKVRLGTGWDDRPASTVADISLQTGIKNDTVLFIGADGSGSEGSRSDTIMYASISKSSGKLRLCSILRDTYVEIPGHKASKINSALALGSNELCVRTLESNFRIKTRKFVRVNMDSLIVVIDELGGVELTLTEAEAKAMNTHFHAQVAKAGTQTLDGAYALYYARIRKIDDDFHRVQRQRVLMSAIAAKCFRASPVKLMSALNKAAPYVTTNMSSAELVNFGIRAAAGLRKDGGCEQMTVPLDGTWLYKQIDGQSCVSADIRVNAEAMRDFLFFNN